MQVIAFLVIKTYCIAIAMVEALQFAPWSSNYS